MRHQTPVTLKPEPQHQGSLEVVAGRVTVGGQMHGHARGCTVGACAASPCATWGLRGMHGLLGIFWKIIFRVSPLQLPGFAGHSQLPFRSHPKKFLRNARACRAFATEAIHGMAYRRTAGACVAVRQREFPGASKSGGSVQLPP